MEPNDTCPACGAPITREALRCPACTAELDWEDEEGHPWERPDGPGRLDSEPHRGDLIRTLGIISIVCAPASIGGGLICLATGFGLGLTAWRMGSRDLALMRAAKMDRRGDTATRTGRILGIVGTGMNALGLLTCGAFLWFLLFRYGGRTF
jgi:hypothetical protein